MSNRSGMLRSMALDVWNASQKADCTPAHIYLTNMNLWPPYGEEFPRLPDSIRWISGDTYRKVWKQWEDDDVSITIGNLSFGNLSIPSSALGCIVYGWRDRIDVSVKYGVRLKALLESGKELEPSFERIIGSTLDDSIFLIETYHKTNENKYVMCVGEHNAIASIWLRDKRHAIAIGLEDLVKEVDLFGEDVVFDMSRFSPLERWDTIFNERLESFSTIKNITIESAISMIWSQFLKESA